MPAINTVSYLDVLLLVNFLVAYFLLQAAGLLSSQHAAFSRMVCASGIASLSALILFAPELSYPAQILYKILTACAVVGVAFGLQGLRRCVTAVLWHAARTILLAGLCIAVILRTGTPLLQTANLTVYLRISPVVLLLLSAASCGAVWLVLHFSGSTPQTTRTIGIEFELCGAPVRLRATLDTGCHLKDPVTCLPVLLISWPAAKGRLPGGVNAFLGQWFQGLHPSTPPVGASLRVIPCITAAQHALLPGLRWRISAPSPKRGCKALAAPPLLFARSRSSPANMKLYMAQIFCNHAAGLYQLLPAILLSRST